MRQASPQHCEARFSKTLVVKQTPEQKEPKISLIVKLKQKESDESVDQPMAAAGEEPGEDIFAPSDPEDEERGDEPEVGEREGPPEPEARPDEDHDGIIEVDVEHGTPRYAKPGSLKREAKTLDHLLTHRYSNPYCDSCIRAKMRHFKTRKNCVQEETIQVW